jgi:hypothetical protein
MFCLGSTNAAQEAYVVYRHTLDLGKLQGKDIQFGHQFGNDATANKGAFAKTPMIRAEYHF